MQLLATLDNLKELKLDNNYNMLLRNITDDTMKMMQNAKEGKKLSINSTITIDNKYENNEIDFNLLT